MRTDYTNPENWPPIPLHVSLFFISLVFFLFLVIFSSLLVSSRNAGFSFQKRRLYISLTILLVGGWLVATQWLAVLGFFRHLYSYSSLLIILWALPIAFATSLFISPTSQQLLKGINGFWLTYIQSFRLFQDFILYLLCKYHALPQEMSFPGYNLDFCVGASAILVSYLCYTRSFWSKRVLIYWNLLGLLSLTWFSILSFSHTPYFNQVGGELPNTIFFRLPFIWIPLFTIPFAFFVHLLSLRKTVEELKVS